MKISNVNSSQNFGSVYALYGSKDQIIDTYNNRIWNKLPKNANITRMMATDIYEKNQGDGILTQAVKNGDKVLFVITGKKDSDAVKFMEWGWSTLNGISHHITEVFNLNEIKQQEIDRILDSAKFEP